MKTYDVTMSATIDATNDADAEKKRVEVEKLLQMPMVKSLLMAKGVKIGAIGKAKARA